VTEESGRKFIHSADADSALREIRDTFGPGRRIVTFLGYSSSGYEDRAAVEALLMGHLEKLDPLVDVVCSGATEVGIGIVYRFAKLAHWPRAFDTMGIVSSTAKKQQVRFDADVDFVFLIEDDRWGGYVDQGGTPSPSSRVMVDASDALIFIGGGEISRDEFDYAARQGKQLHFDAADMNHNTAITKAQRKGEAAPTDFKGAVHERAQKDA